MNPRQDKTPKGVVIYRGPSVLDGKPIVAIATVSSANRKTGDMIQVWVMRADIDPVQAVAQGLDSSICGSCYHRGTETRARTCYVNIGQAPLGVWRSWKRGIYKRGTLQSLIEQTGGKEVRCGAYGDPVAVPWKAWDGLQLSRLWTGYTHQWSRMEARPFRAILMASCDSELDAMAAAAAGWRTFTVAALGSPAVANAVLCPSVSHGTQCKDCGLCSGQQRFQAPSVWIEAHGTAKRFVGVA